MEVSKWTRYDDRLVAALGRHQAAKVRKLVTLGVDVSKIDSKTGMTAVHMAVIGGDISMVDLLIKSLVFDVNARDMTGRTPLHCAVLHARSDITRRLIECNPDMQAVDRNRKSALHYACEGCHLGCVQLLLHHGASVFLKDEGGRSPLSYAAERGQASICRLLLEHKANVNDTDNENRTSLMIAVDRKHAAVCDYLIQKGADVGIVDVQGRDALAIARSMADQQASHDIIKLLERAIADQNSRLLRQQQTNGSAEHDDAYENGPHVINGDVQQTSELTMSVPTNGAEAATTARQTTRTSSSAFSMIDETIPMNVSESPFSSTISRRTEPEIEYEFRQNLRHLELSGDSEVINGGSVKLSQILEDNVDSVTTSREVVADDGGATDEQRVRQETSDSELDDFNRQQLKAVVNELRRDVINLQQKVSELDAERQQLESTNRQLGTKFQFLSEEQSWVNRGILDVLDVVRELHNKLVDVNAANSAAIEFEQTTEERSPINNGPSADASESSAEKPEVLISEFDRSFERIQSMILNLLKSESTKKSLRVDEKFDEETLRRDQTDLVAGLNANPVMTDYDGLTTTVARLTLEKTDLQERIRQLIADNAEMARQLDDVERLLSAVEEFRLENRALVDDCARLTQTMKEVEREETAELERFVNEFMLVVGENESLKQRVRELSAKGGQTYAVSVDQTDHATVGENSIQEGIETETETGKRCEVSQIKPNCQPQHLSMESLVAENEALRAELTLLNEAIRRQTVTILEMDETLREKADSKRQKGFVDSTDEVNLAKIQAAATVRDAEDHLRRAIGDRDMEIVRLRDELYQLKHRIEEESEEYRTVFQLVKPETDDRRRSSGLTDDAREIAVHSVVLERFLETPPRENGSGLTATTKEFSPLQTSSQHHDDADSKLKPGHVERPDSRPRRLSNDSGIIARGLSTIGSNRDEETNVCEADLGSTTTACRELVRNSREMADNVVDTELADYESELSFNLARAMIDCQRVVQENRRLRRELTSLRTSSTAASSNRTAAMAASMTRNRSSDDYTREKLHCFASVTDAGEGRLEHENQKLKTYAKELESEIKALKRTVEEQSIYLSSTPSSAEISRRKDDHRKDGSSAPEFCFWSTVTSPWGSIDTSKRRTLDTLLSFESSSKWPEYSPVEESFQQLGNLDAAPHHHQKLNFDNVSQNVATTTNKNLCVADEETQTEIDCSLADSRVDLVEAIRQQNSQLREELDATKKDWAEYEMFADETRAKLHSEIERLRCDQSTVHEELSNKEDTIRQLEARLNQLDGELAACLERLERSQTTTKRYNEIASDAESRLKEYNIGIDILATGDVDDDGGNMRQLQNFRCTVENLVDLGLSKLDSQSERCASQPNTFDEETKTSPKRVFTGNDGEGKLLEMANLTIDELSTKIAEVDNQMVKLKAENIKLRQEIEDYDVQLITATTRAARLNEELAAREDELGCVTAVADEESAALRAEVRRLREEIASTEAAHLDPDYEEQLLVEIEHLRSELRSAQRALRERDYELEETRDELLETQGRLQQQQQASTDHVTSAVADVSVSGNVERQQDQKVNTTVERSTAAAAAAEEREETLLKELEAAKQRLEDVESTYKRLLDEAESKRQALTVELEQLKRRAENETQKPTTAADQRQEQTYENKARPADEELQQAMLAIQDHVSAENGRLSSELVRSRTERQKLEDRCDKLQSDCLAFEELSNELTERCQRLSTELARLRSSAPSSSHAEQLQHQQNTQAKPAVELSPPSIPPKKNIHVDAETNEEERNSIRSAAEFSARDKEIEDVAELIKLNNELAEQNRALTAQLQQATATAAAASNRTVWTVSVQRNLSSNTSTQTDVISPGSSPHFSAGYRDPRQPVTSVDALVSETKSLCQQTIGLHRRLWTLLSSVVSKIEPSENVRYASTLSPPAPFRPQEVVKILTDHDHELMFSESQNSDVEVAVDWDPRPVSDNSDDVIVRRLQEANRRLSVFVVSLSRLTNQLQVLVTATLSSEHRAVPDVCQASTIEADDKFSSKMSSESEREISHRQPGVTAFQGHDQGRAALGMIRQCLIDANETAIDPDVKTELLSIIEAAFRDFSA